MREVAGTGEAAAIGFHVDMDNSLAPGLQVRCTHHPLSPQPGQSVTITAEALDDNFNLLLSDRIEIFMNLANPPVAVSTNASSATFSATPAGDFSYYCRVTRSAGVSEDTVWHLVPVGINKFVMPVIYTGNPSNALDVVFIADSNSYATGSSTPQFLTAVENMIRNGFYGQNVFLETGAMTNFWIARDTGTASATNACDFSGPNHWGDAYGFANVGVIIKASGGGCARRAENLLTVGAGSFPIVLHETGHSPIGLADEYDKNGGSSCYFQPDPEPNIYETEGSCHDDLAALHRVGETCREFEVTYLGDCDGPSTWWTSEPATNDMMNDNGDPQAADLRRIESWFRACGRGYC